MTSPTPQETEPLFSPLAADPDLSELVEMYVDEMPDRIAALQEMLVSDNWEELRRLAHQMKGAAGSYGFDDITPIAAQLESAVRNGDTEEAITQAVEELIRICQRVRAGTPK